MRFNYRKTKAFIYRHRFIIAITVWALVLAIAILVYFWGTLKTNLVDSLPLIPKKEEVETRVEAPLTGLMVDSSFANRRALAVVVENSPDARPQSGLNDADIVYETVAEGGITRMLAVYQSKDSNEIGPVRSARFYFIDWLSEIGAVFVHIGGNIMALDEIKAKAIPDINQFFYGSYFWRDPARYAPHNVYTTTKKIYSAISKAGYDKNYEVKKLTFKKEAALEERTVSQTIKIPFSSYSFLVSYLYDRNNNDYVRSIAGVVHKDKKTGLAIRPKNVVVQFESITNIKSRDGVTTGKIATIGTGRAIVFQDGKAIPATWNKASRSAQTRLIDSNGQEIALNPGQTWFEIVPLTAKVTY